MLVAGCEAKRSAGVAANSKTVNARRMEISLYNKIPCFII
jgi:hypothetical protein